MKRFVIGSALLLVFLLSGPAARACGYLCTEVSANCWQCEWTGAMYGGCRQVSACMCIDEQCWAPAAAHEKVTPEDFGIFAPTPSGKPMTPALPVKT